MWDVHSGNCVHTLAGIIGFRAVSADGRIAIDLADYKVGLWDLTSERRLHTFENRSRRQVCAEISADASTVLTQHDDSAVRAWVMDWEYEFPPDDSAGEKSAADVNRAQQKGALPSSQR